MQNQTFIKWLPIICKRLGDMMFAVSLALILSVIVTEPKIIVHVIGHPAYLTTEPDSVETTVIKVIMILICFVLCCYFDKKSKEF